MQVFIPHPIPHPGGAPGLGRALLGEPERHVQGQERALLGEDGQGQFLLPAVVLLHDLAGRVLGAGHHLGFGEPHRQGERHERLAQVLKAEGLLTVARGEQVRALVAGHPARHQVVAQNLGHVELRVPAELRENEVRGLLAFRLLQRQQRSGHPRLHGPRASVGVVLPDPDRQHLVTEVDVAVLEPQEMAHPGPLTQGHAVEHPAPERQVSVAKQPRHVAGVDERIGRRGANRRQPPEHGQGVLLLADDAARAHRRAQHGLQHLIVGAHRARALGLGGQSVGSNSAPTVSLGQASEGDVTDDAIDGSQQRLVCAPRLGGMRELLLVRGEPRVARQLVGCPARRKLLKRRHPGHAHRARLEALLLFQVPQRQLALHGRRLGRRGLGHEQQELSHLAVVTERQEVVAEQLEVPLALAQLQLGQGGRGVALEAHVTADPQPDEVGVLAHGLPSASMNETSTQAAAMIRIPSTNAVGQLMARAFA